LTAAFVLMAGSAANAAQPPVGLGTATSFSVLAGSTVTNTGATTMAGDLGVSPGAAITGFPPGLVGRATHSADAVAGQAESDLTTAYIDAAGRTPVTTLATELGGQTLTTGVYDSSTGTFGLTGTLTLDAEGNADAVFIFHTASTLITGVGSSVSLINAAQACNVFWQIGSSATIATTSSFKGTIMALTSIAMQTGATLEGRAFARNGAVTLDTNVITIPGCAAATPTPTPSPTPSPSPGGGGGATGTGVAGLTAVAGVVATTSNPRRTDAT
jgi:hypothetical protein